MDRSYTTPFDTPDPFGSTPSWKSWADQLDPVGDRYNWNQWSEPLLSFGTQARGGVEFDPLPRGEIFDTSSQLFGMQQTSADIDAWMRRAYPQNFLFPEGGQSGVNPGAIGSPGGDWAAVDQWDDGVLAAVRQVQQELGVYVPPNVVKSIMRIESGGQFNAGQGAESPHGARGLMQVTDSTMGQYDYARLLTDANYGIYAGVKELALRYNDAKRINAAYGWDNVAVGYFSGHYEPNGSSDGFSTDFQYQERFNDNWSQLNAGVNTGVGGAPPTGTTNLNVIWGGITAPDITQDFGPTDFSQNVRPEWYEYGADYTRDRKPLGHTGLDVGVVYGTVLYTPVSGTVICAGTGRSNGEDGCSAYTTEVGSANSGRFQIKIDGTNDMLILGHMSDITVQPGQHLTAGMAVGKSGIANGDHVHIEYRRWVGEGVTNTGWELIQPAEALLGNFTGVLGAAGQGGTIAFAASPNNWNDFMRNAASGLPLAGQSPAVGGFHDYLLRAMRDAGIDTPSKPSVFEPDGPPVGWIYGYGDAPPAPPPPD